MHPALALAPSVRTLLLLVAVGALAVHFVDVSALLTDFAKDAVSPW